MKNSNDIYEKGYKFGMEAGALAYKNALLATLQNLKILGVEYITIDSAIEVIREARIPKENNS